MYNPSLPSGIERTRFPDAAKSAFVTAGVAGAIGGSPKPVGE